MAHIGHGLLGLTAAALRPPRQDHSQYYYVWPGALVLAAYLVDVAEWAVVLWNPTGPDTRFASHSPLALAALTLLACLGAGLLFRSRQAWDYILLAGAVASHVILDMMPVRRFVAQLYGGFANAATEAEYISSVGAEAWFYGFPLCLALLVRGSREPTAGPRARRWSLMLGGFTLVTACFPRHVLWMPAYGVALLHAALLMHRHLRVRLLANAIPLVPVAALALTTLLCQARINAGLRLAAAGRHDAAVTQYRSAMRLPSREGRPAALLRMGMSYEHLGRLDDAAHCYEEAMSYNLRSAWSDVLLARLYSRFPHQPFYRPVEARRMLEDVLADGRAVADAQRAAALELRHMEVAGLSPHREPSP